MKRRGMTIAAAFVAGAMMLAGVGAAHADDLVTDNLSGNNINIGEVACGAPVSRTVDLKIKRQGNTASQPQTVYANGVDVAISKVSQSGVSATSPSPSLIRTPDNWTGASTNTLTGLSQSTVTVDTSVAGTYQGTVTYESLGRSVSGGNLRDEVQVRVSWTVLSCNTTPSDSVAPVVELTCPTGQIVRNEPATASWIATDDTGFASGIVTSGTVELDTSTYGAKTKTLAAGFIADAAGNTSAAVSCDYFVTEQDPPVVTFANCPDPLKLVMEQEYVLTWNATDEEGGSGLATDATGTITIDTDIYGAGSVTAPIARDNAGNASTEVKCEYFVDDVTPPVVNLTCPVGPFLLGETVPDAQWTAYDPSPGSGLDGADSGSFQVDTSSVGTKQLEIEVADFAGNKTKSSPCTFSVVYDWSGFFRPVDTGNVVNSVKAGSAVPIKFSLGGDQGLGILDGAPTLKWIACSAGATVDPIEVTVSTAGGSSLSYDPLTNQYNYVWKTDKNWAGKCGTLQVKLNDGTTHTADFKLLK